MCFLDSIHSLIVLVSGLPLLIKIQDVELDPHLTLWIN